MLVSRQRLLSIVNFKSAASFAVTAVLFVLLNLLGADNRISSSVLILVFGIFLYFSDRAAYFGYAAGTGAGIVAVITAYYVRILLDTYSNIYEWDFLAFYVYGKSGADGLNFYDPAGFPALLESIRLPFSITDMFRDYIIKVGVCYPPTTMLLLAPIGQLDYLTANTVWRSLILLFLLLDIYLMYKLFRLYKDRLLQFLAISSLILILPGTTSTVFLAQTNFFLLFFLLLIFHKPDHWKAGMFLALAMIIKPIVAVLGIYYLIHLKWKPLIGAAITGLLIVVTTIASFGYDNFLAFFTTSPTSRIPYQVYIEDINQSMNAVFSRISIQYQLNFLLENMSLIVVLVSIILVVLTIIASRKLYRRDPLASFLIFLPLSLLVYPGCLSHYVVQMIPLVLLMVGTKTMSRLFLITGFMIIMKFSSFTSSLLILSFLFIYAFSNLRFFKDWNLSYLTRNEGK